MEEELLVPEIMPMTRQHLCCEKKLENSLSRIVECFNPRGLNRISLTKPPPLTPRAYIPHIQLTTLL